MPAESRRVSTGILGVLYLEYAAFAATSVGGYPRWMVGSIANGTAVNFILRETQYRYMCIPEIEHQYTAGGSFRTVSSTGMCLWAVNPVIG